MNKTVRVYHSGATDDLEFVIDQFEERYEEIALIGFSLGGNLSLVYGGQKEYDILSKITSITAISTPTHLTSASQQISKKSNFIYEQKFLRSLKEKVILKSKLFPEIYTQKKLKKVKTLFDFDNIFTGPIGGFKDAIDYYTKCSSRQFIPRITIPTLIINALDDPFLPKECYPYTEVNQNKKVHLLTPKYGGHVGFAHTQKKYFWSEEMILKFINQNSKK